MANEYLKSENTNKEKLWTVPYIYLIIINILLGLSFSMFSPILPLYSVSIGASLGVAGMISGILAVTALIVRPFSGLLSDNFNRKRVMLLGTALIAFSVIGFSFSNTVFLLFVFRIIQGAGLAISGTATITIVSLIIPKSRMGEGISSYGLSQIIATAAGPNLGILASQKLGYQDCFYIAAVFAVMSCILMLFLRYDESAEAENKAANKGIHFSSMISLAAIPNTLVTSCFSFVNGVTGTFIVMYGMYKHFDNIGLYFIVNAGVLLVSRMVLGKISDRVKLPYVFYPSLALGIIAVILLSIANSIWFIIAAAALYALGQGVGQPALMAATIKKVDAGRRGIAMSTYMIGADIGQGVGPTLGGSISEKWGYETMFAFCSLVLALGSGIFSISLRKKRQPIPLIKV